MDGKSLRSIRAPLLSLILPTLLRTLDISPTPLSLFLPIGILFLVIEKGYIETLETLSPELSEHTGPFWHIGVCLLAQIFVHNLGGWRGEVLYWTIFARWAAGMNRYHRAGVKVFRDAYVARTTANGARLHGVLAATLLTPVFVTERISWMQVAAVWLHFYHSVGYALAVWTYFGLPEKQKRLVEERRRSEASSGH